MTGLHASIAEAARHMARVREETFKPSEEHARIYDRLYAEYVKLQEYFGQGGNAVMKRLKAMKEV